jgi:acyl-CoA synthetase
MSGMVKTVASLINEHAGVVPSRPAYIVGETKLTWAQYDDCSQQLARSLVKLGFQAGDRLAVLLPNGPGVHIAWVAAETAGLVIVAISDRAGFREIEHALSLTGAAGLISRREHLGRPMADFVQEMRDNGLSIKHHLTTEGELIEADSFLVDGAPPESNLAGKNLDARIQERRLAASDLFLLNFTSGTTGMPKCVRHNQARWFGFHVFARAAGDLSESDVFMSVVPSPYGFGIWTGHVTPTILRAPTVLMPRFGADDAIRLIERHRVTVLAAVTTQFIMMLNSPVIKEADFSSLRLLSTGGEAVSYERAAEFEDLTGARVLQFYGSNEVGAVSGTTLRDPRDKRLGTAGRPIPEMNLRLFDENGEDITPTRRGRPGCRGPTLSGGYYGDAAANAELIRKDGWMMLGDLVQIDDEGYLHVIGRTDDFIIRGGKNISGPGVEQQVATHPAVALAAAVPMPDETFGERVCVYVELRPGASLDMEGLTAHLADRHVSKETWPERLIVLSQLPRNPGGKVAKRELRDDIARRIAKEQRS